ncbi:MAG: hypothetical protein U0166_17180 [Acidobacteriota bacterium]
MAISRWRRAGARAQTPCARNELRDAGQQDHRVDLPVGRDRLHRLADGAAQTPELALPWRVVRHQHVESAALERDLAHHLRVALHVLDARSVHLEKEQRSRIRRRRLHAEMPRARQHRVALQELRGRRHDAPLEDARERLQRRRHLRERA